jgi:hypothetical protein
MVRMIDTPYGFEQKLSKDEFEKLGRFACRWSHIEHTVSNCLRRLLDMDPKIAQIMVFPLTLNAKMNAISDVVEHRDLSPYQIALLQELKPLILAIQYIRNTVLHGVVIDLFPDEPPFRPDQLCRSRVASLSAFAWRKGGPRGLQSNTTC